MTNLGVWFVVGIVQDQDFLAFVPDLTSLRVLGERSCIAQAFVTLTMNPSFI